MIKISLDHKIIRDLIDKDEEFHLELKRSVLKTALQHNLWDVLDDEVKSYLRDVEYEFRKEVNKEVVNMIMNYEQPSWQWKPDASLQKLAEREVERQINKLIGDKIKSYGDVVNKMIGDTLEGIEDKVEKILTEQIESVIMNKVSERLKVAFDEILKR